MNELKEILTLRYTAAMVNRTEGGGDSADVEVLRSPSAIATIARLSRKRAQACRHFDVRSRRIISKLIGEVNERRTASYASHCDSRGM